MPVWLSAVVAVIGSIAKSALAFLIAIKLGIERAEKASLQKHADRMQEAHEAEIYAKNSDDPDPFIRP